MSFESHSRGYLSDVHAGAYKMYSSPGALFHVTFAHVRVLHLTFDMHLGSMAQKCLDNIRLSSLYGQVQCGIIILKVEK